MSTKLHHCVVISSDHQAWAGVLKRTPVTFVAFKQALNNKLTSSLLTDSRTFEKVFAVVRMKPHVDKRLRLGVTFYGNSLEWQGSGLFHKSEFNCPEIRDRSGTLPAISLLRFVSRLLGGC